MQILHLTLAECILRVNELPPEAWLFFDAESEFYASTRVYVVTSETLFSCPITLRSCNMSIDEMQRIIDQYPMKGKRLDLVCVIEHLNALDYQQP